MDNFVALIRDTLASKNPVGTWREAKNILLTKGLKSIANEDGFKFEYLVPGTIIGVIPTNSHVVYFIKNEEGVDEIGVVNTNNDTPIYTTKLKTNLLNFQLNCPIEGIFVYNYKEELIISWCDGVYSNSNPPRVLNVSNLPFSVGVDGTLLNPLNFSIINLTPSIHQGTLNINYTDFGIFGGYAVYITFSYVYNDKSLAGYFPVSDLAYVGNGTSPTTQYGISLNFTDLDTSFNKLKIGILVRTDSTNTVASELIGYESEEIVYTGNSLNTTINSLNNFTVTSSETLLIEQAYFTKVQTITKYENQAYIANVETTGNFNFQKYANLINIVPIEYLDDVVNYKDIPKKGQDASFPPDDVIAFSIQLQLLNGEYTNAFHIPGREAQNTEKDDITPTQITDFDLGWTTSEVGIKQFHVFNNGYAASMVAPTIGTPNPVPLDESTNKFGYWENEETYPDSDEYNSTLDYQGNPLTGADLRNTPIRYHRFPSVHSMYENNIGSVIFGLPNKIGNPGTTIEKQNRFKKFGIKITNIEDVIPSEILDQIQGYRICHVERTSNNSYVAGNWIAIRRKDVDDKRTQVNSDGFFEHYDFGYYPFDTNDIDFQRVRVLGNELFKFRPSLSPLYIQANYKFQIKNEFLIGNESLPTGVSRYSKCYSPLIYRPGNSVANNTEFHEEGINLDLKPDFHAEAIGDNPSGAPGAFYPYPYFQYYVLNITAYSHKLNVYAGFNSDALTIIGRTSIIQNNTIFKKGDNFVENELEVYLRSRVRTFNPSYSNGQPAYIQIRRSIYLNIQGLNSPVNVSKLFNDAPVDRDTTDPVILEGNDYEFEVIHKESLSSVQNVLAIFTFNINDDFVNRFPYRIYKGIKQANENLSFEALSSYLINDYYEMPNDKGEIIALRGNNDTLYIQHRFTLFIAAIKDTLKTDGTSTYLGRSDLFSRPPYEVLGDDKGYVGSISKFACIIIKDMYITINQVNGQIFVIKGNTAIEITNKGNKNWFWDNWDNGLNFYYIGENEEKRRIDNPFISVGHLVGYDKQYDRLLFTKKLYEFKFPDLIGETVEDGVVNFDGEFYSMNGVLLEFTDEDNFINKSKTFSFNISSDNWSWISPHDYFPNLIYYTSNGLYSITNRLTGINRATVYKHNDNTTKGLFYGQKFSSYVDLIFNGNLELSKLLMNISWITDVINNNGGNENFKTITHIAVYNENQCSGIINLRNNHFKLTRNVEGDWNFNEFRDLVINPNNPILMDNGDINTTNINNVKLWFDKSNFISKFITVRLLIDNRDNDTVYIHDVKVSSLISKK